MLFINHFFICSFFSNGKGACLQDLNRSIALTQGKSRHTYYLPSILKNLVLSFFFATPAQCSNLPETETSNFIESVRWLNYVEWLKPGFLGLWLLSSIKMVGDFAVQCSAGFVIYNRWSMFGGYWKLSWLTPCIGLLVNLARTLERYVL